MACCCRKALFLVYVCSFAFIPSPVTPTSPSGKLRVLFVGNSMFYKGVIPHQIHDILHERPGIEVEVVTYTQRAGRWDRQVKDMADPQAFVHVLLGNASQLPGWDWVIFNEHSETPGMYEDPEPDSKFVKSRDALVQMVELAHFHGAKVMLMSTWAWAKGNPKDADRFPNFKVMNQKIHRGSVMYADYVKQKTGIPVYVAPAGAALLAIQEKSISMQPILPMCQGAGKSLFACLFVDYKHLGPWGGYMASCVISSSITGQRSSGIKFAHQGLPDVLRDYLQRVADAVVFDGLNLEQADRRFPWETS